MCDVTAAAIRIVMCHDMTVFSFPYTPSCEPRLLSGGLLRSSYLDTWFVAMACGERRATRAVHSRVAACVAAGGGIFENQLKHR